MQLIDPDDYVFGEATHVSGGVELHKESDCPKDSSCPVWAYLHKHQIEVVIRLEPVEPEAHGCTDCQVHVFGPDDTVKDGGQLGAILTNFAEGTYYPQGSYLRPVRRTT